MPKSLRGTEVEAAKAAGHEIVCFLLSLGLTKNNLALLLV
jgi:hypothetical protein